MICELKTEEDLNWGLTGWFDNRCYIFIKDNEGNARLFCRIDPFDKKQKRPVAGAVNRFGECYSTRWEDTGPISFLQYEIETGSTILWVGSWAEAIQAFNW